MDWVKGVTTDSTFPPKGTFLQSAENVARIMAMPQVSPLGIKSAIRMVNYFINRGGRGLTEERKRELRRAIEILKTMKEPNWTEDLPIECQKCHQRIKNLFFVARKVSDKQLITVCAFCVLRIDVSEARQYRRIDSTSFASERSIWS